MRNSVEDNSSETVKMASVFIKVNGDENEIKEEYDSENDLVMSRNNLIEDSLGGLSNVRRVKASANNKNSFSKESEQTLSMWLESCLLYTSDAADE